MSEQIPSRLREALADRYELHEELGAGGMATVYLADDIKHERKVAVKVLRPELAAVIGGERFIAEIKTTAALQHPHILPLFDSGEADSFLYYVMPYVEGESLRKHIDRERQLEVEEAVHIAKAVASALQYAHERDIIHRDIKPENVLLHAGEPVVADFGIALAISAAGGGRMTETGLSLGTPHYMSPEQAAADRDLSARSDVYSVACVLYEMLAGQPPHTGPTAQSVLVRILTEDPRPVAEIRPTVPKHLRAVVSKGLEKLPADRFKSAEEFKAAMDDESFTYERVKVTGAQAGVTAAAVTEAPGPAGISSRVYAAAAVFFALTTVFFALGPRQGAAPAVSRALPLVTFTALDNALDVDWVEVGPDGTLAYAEDGFVQVRRPGALEAAPLEGVTGAREFSISPEGEWLVFASGGGGNSRLDKVQIGGGPIANVWSTSAAAARYPFWGEDGWIYFVSGQGLFELHRVRDVGGESELLLGQSSSLIFNPRVLPGGKAVLFTAAGAGLVRPRVMLYHLETGDTTAVLADGANAMWSETGHVIYGQSSGALWAVPFDLAALEVTGDPVPVLEGIRTFQAFTEYGLNSSGTMAFVSGAATGAGAVGGAYFALIDEEGNRERLPVEPSDHPDARLSPDGSSLAYVRGNDIWMFDLDRGSDVQLTEGGTGQHNPIWSPDGTRIAYRSADDIMVRSSDLSSAAEPVTSTDQPDNPMEWLDDGTLIIGTEILRDGDIMSVSMEDDTPAQPILNANWQERAAAVSPDGRWLAYQSARSDEPRFYVRSWPGLENETLVSLAEGFMNRQSYPLWSPDSRTLYYHVGDRIVAARLDASDGIRVVSSDTLPFVMVGARTMDMHPDGRLLITEAQVAAQAQGAAAETAEKLIVSTNWFTELRARLGSGN